MEIVDTAIMLLIPGAMAAGLDDAVLGRARAARSSRALAALPVNRWLIPAAGATP